MVILLIEDNASEAKLTREALREAGVQHELFVVSDGECATRFLKQERGYETVPRPNVILLDLNLPGKHGREVLTEIKHDRTLCHIPVIVFSNSQATEDVDAVYQLGGNGYVVKSGDLDEFFASVKALVDFWMTRSRLPSVLKNGSKPEPVL